MSNPYRARYDGVFGGKAPVLGMVHMLALPGAPGFSGNLNDVIDRAVQDATTLVEGGVDAVLVENFHDYPFYPMTTEPETVAAAAVVAREVARATDVPMGINILRNSWKASLGIAAAVDAQFIRLNILTDAAVTDQGIINSEAYAVARYKKAIDGEHILTLADLLTKHAMPLVDRPVTVIAGDMLKRGGADAIVLAGHDSSEPASLERINEIKGAIPDAPIVLGSGMTAEHAANYGAVADGAVFGWGSKENHDMDLPVSGKLTSEFVGLWRSGKQHQQAA
ncbi:BtpA/SgcQ family protein [Agrococcus sp. Marseille-Q4369]|uniref:BtpA/SgcQ family protein n=1 Tax=Agrococcus sp. Marseille-Q4369 TaxID=2810513 RepID=UPI001B8D32AA|nr:BtpA/SgcQ family protein [Agrococcus sp. Marseille-Q4369]QUW17836.1 BtpA/SgcQ family protein [Agrococcus sp. Marseille-Q4369]